jgi:biofilm PGA synthesis N-glycosyltransferase PgaC
LFLIIFLGVIIAALCPYFVRIFTLAYSRYLKHDSKKDVIRVISRDADVLPKISVILPVYNEEKRVCQKIQNLLLLDYPPDKLEIVVVDGYSIDKTTELVESIKDKRINLIKNKNREGVTQAAKDGVRASAGEVIVLTDTEAIFKDDVLKLLAEDLKDPFIGAITGVEEIVNPHENPITEMEYAHRAFYNLFSISESVVYSTYYFRGEFAGIRKSLFPMNVDSQKGVLDVEIALSAIRAGYRAKCDPRIKFFGLAAGTLNDRNKQKIQRATLNQESIIQNRDLLWTPNLFGRVIFPCTFAIHMVSPVLFMISIALSPLAMLELPWQIDALVLSAIAISCLITKVRNTFLTFVQSQVYLFIGLMKATIFGRPKFLSQVESTRRDFDPHS